MPTYTPNYNLVKPLDTEFYNVNDQNSNMDSIDTQIKANADGLQSLTTTVNNNANSINALDTRVTAVEQQELEIATTAEAIAGNNNTKSMTPLATKYAMTVAVNGDNEDLDTTNVPFLIKNIGGTYYYVETKFFNVFGGAQAVQVRYTYLGQPDISTRHKFENVWSDWSPSLQELFQSGSNGKAQVAAAITAKGVQTAADATFNTLANNISLITTGAQKATGTVTSTGPIGFTMQNGSIQNGLGLVTVSGLGFRPNKINIYLDPSDGNFYETSYNSQYSNAFNGARLSSYSGGNITVITLNINTTVAPCYINNNGFALPVQFVGNNFSWYAEG